MYIHIYITCISTWVYVCICVYIDAGQLPGLKLADDLIAIQEATLLQDFVHVPEPEPQPLAALPPLPAKGKGPDPRSPELPSEPRSP